MGWSDWAESAKDYGRSVSQAYLAFLTPVLMLVVFNACVSLHAHDMEKEGMLWMHYSQEDAQDRTSQFPRTEDEGVHARARRSMSIRSETAADLAVSED